MAFANRVVNFAAGPAQLPLDVLQEAQASLLNYKNSGQSVLEYAARRSGLARPASIGLFIAALRLYPLIFRHIYLAGLPF